MDLLPSDPDERVRRILEIAEEALKLKGAGLSPDDIQALFQAEHAFWYRILSEEVERGRFEKGLESIRITFNPVPKKTKFSDPDYVGKTVLLGRTWYATLHHSFDEKQREIIKFKLSPKP
jgi:hypothetical protein